MLPQTDSPEASPLIPLSPARAVLAAAIDTLDIARNRLEELHAPLGRLERVLLAAQSVEAAELRNEISRLLTTNVAEGTGSANGRPSVEKRSLPPGLLEAEERLSNLAKGAADAEKRLAAAREEYVTAAGHLRVVSAEREEALWPAAVEAVDADLSKLEDAVRGVLVIEARLRSLILALRETGHRVGSDGSGAFAAAERIEAKVTELRRRPVVTVDIEIGRSLIDRLRSDPTATL